MSVYRGKVIRLNGNNKTAMVVVPQISGTKTQLAQVPESLSLAPGGEIWVAYEGGDRTRPVVVCG